MKKIEELKIKNITLENVKVKFQVKLLQYNLNSIIYRYRQKYAFKEIVDELINKLTKEVIKSNLKEDEEAGEIITKAREIIKQLIIYSKNCNITPKEAQEGVDCSLRYILYYYSKNKERMELEEQIELLKELVLFKKVISNYNLNITDRINNAYKLEKQLRESICLQL